MHISLLAFFVDLGVSNTVGLGCSSGSGFFVGNVLSLKLLRIFFSCTNK